MDIMVYDEIFSGLEEFLKEKGAECHNPSLVHYASAKPTYPYVILEEVRNNEGRVYQGEIPDITSNLGYRVRIYAKTKGKVTKMQVARTVAKYVDWCLCSFGLRQVSYNPDPLVADGDLFGIILMYNTNLYNNRRKITR